MVEALIVGHSWGGHLALRFAAAHPERLLGALAVDPLGIVGDGGMAAFEAELLARTPKEGRERARELDERAMAGEGTAEDFLESLAIVWPAYFADPWRAPAMPPIRMSVEAYSGIAGELTAGAEEVCARLAHERGPRRRDRRRRKPDALGPGGPTSADSRPRRSDRGPRRRPPSPARGARQRPRQR